MYRRRVIFWCRVFSIRFKVRCLTKFCRALVSKRWIKMCGMPNYLWNSLGMMNVEFKWPGWFYLQRRGRHLQGQILQNCVGLMPFSNKNKNRSKAVFCACRVWSVRYNHFHDQLLLSSSSDSRVILNNIISLSSEPFGHLDEEDEEDGRQEKGSVANQQ